MTNWPLKLRHRSRSSSTISSTVFRRASVRAAGAYLAYAVGIAFAAFQLYVAAFNYLPSQVVRGIHVGFLHPADLRPDRQLHRQEQCRPCACWLIGAAGFLCGLYQWIFYADLIARDGDPTRLDLAVGTLLAVLIFEGTRRLMGLALPLMCGACLLYWLFGQYLPSPFDHRGYRFRSGHQPSLLRHRGHLRRADLRLGHLHLPVHPVRRVPRARRHDPAVQRCRPRPRRPAPGRTGQGRGDLVGH